MNNPELTERVVEGAQRWRSHGIKDYRIVMQFYEYFTQGLDTRREVIVRNGVISEASCVSDECPAFVLSEIHTVEDLFYKAYDICLESVRLDLTYGFPRSMSFDCDNWNDEEHDVRVVEFEVLK